MDEENNNEDTPAEELDDGTLQDETMSIRFYVDQIMEQCQRLILLKFGKEVTLEEARMLEDVNSPFDRDSPEEMEAGMTQEEYDEARAEYFARIEKLRPTFLRLFDLDEETAEYQVCDLGNPITAEVRRLDAYLVTAFRFNLKM